MSSHHPQRGDAVAQWIKSYRDRYDSQNPAWHVLDDLLDDYRLLADRGRPLPDTISQMSDHDDHPYAG